MNTKEAAALHARVLEVLRREFPELSPAVARSPGTITAVGCELKFEFTQGGAEAKAGARQAEFAKHARLFGLDPTDFGLNFTSNGRSYRIVGLNVTKPKYCVATERDDGKPFSFPAETVQYRLAQMRRVVA